MNRRNTRAALCVLAIACLALSVAAAGLSSSKKVTKITVVSLIPGSTQEAKDQFNARVKQFEKLNPTIKVTGKEYQ